MKIASGRIQNFLTIGEAAINLADKGLVLIQGVNVDDSSADSNGAGKSTIPDALSWCFFGVTARGETGDAVILDAVGKNCFVSWDVVDEHDTKWTVSRYRKHPKMKNQLRLEQTQLDGSVVDLTKGTDKLTQPLVSALLGCSVEVFNAAVYSGQDQMPDLPGMTDRPLKMLIEEASGVDRLENAHKIAKRHLSDREADLERLRLERAEFEHALEVAIDSVKDNAEALKLWKKEQAKKIDRKLAEKEDMIAQWETLSGELSIVTPRAEIEASLDKLKDKLAQKAEEESNLKELEAHYNKMRTQSEIEANNVAALIKQAQSDKKALDNVALRIGEPCDECGTPLTAESLDDVTSAAKKRLIASLTRVKAAKESARLSLAASKQTREDVDSYIERMTDYEEVHRQSNELQRELANLSIQEDAINQLVKNIERVGAEIEEINTEKSPIADMLKKARAKKEAAKDKLGKDSDRALATAEVACNVARAAVDVYGPGGVRAHILDSVTPFLNDRTAHYLGSLSDGNITATWNTLTRIGSGELREKFSIEVSNSKGAKRFKGLSGGEKRKVRLGCAMALQDLVASRATKPIDLFMADEIDHALDDAGLERLMGLLNEKAKERGTVLVVSHNALDDWISNVTTVIKEGGSSRVEGAIAE